MLKINTLGPLLLSKHFSPFLARRSTKLESIPDLPASSVLALMSARVGSTSDNRLGGWYSYRASKAAVNSIAKSVDIYLGQRCGDNAMCVVRTSLAHYSFVHADRKPPNIVLGLRCCPIRVIYTDPPGNASRDCEKWSELRVLGKHAKGEVVYA